MPKISTSDKRNSLSLVVCVPEVDPPPVPDNLFTDFKTFFKAAGSRFNRVVITVFFIYEPFQPPLFVLELFI